MKIEYRNNNLQFDPSYLEGAKILLGFDTQVIHFLLSFIIANENKGIPPKVFFENNQREERIILSRRDISLEDVETVLLKAFSELTFSQWYTSIDHYVRIENAIIRLRLLKSSLGNEEVKVLISEPRVGRDDSTGVVFGAGVNSHEILRIFSEQIKSHPGVIPLGRVDQYRRVFSLGNTRLLLSQVVSNEVSKIRIEIEKEDHDGEKDFGIGIVKIFHILHLFGIDFEYDETNAEFVRRANQPKPRKQQRPRRKSPYARE